MIGVCLGLPAHFRREIVGKREKKEFCACRVFEAEELAFKRHYQMGAIGRAQGFGTGILFS